MSEQPHHGGTEGTPQQRRQGPQDQRDIGTSEGAHPLENEQLRVSTLRCARRLSAIGVHRSAGASDDLSAHYGDRVTESRTRLRGWAGDPRAPLVDERRGGGAIDHAEHLGPGDAPSGCCVEPCPPEVGELTVEAEELVDEVPLDRRLGQALRLRRGKIAFALSAAGYDPSPEGSVALAPAQCVDEAPVMPPRLVGSRPLRSPGIGSRPR